MNLNGKGSRRQTFVYLHHGNKKFQNQKRAICATFSLMKYDCPKPQKKLCRDILKVNK